MTISTSKLMLNPDGSVYHLNLFPDEIADTIILVGDPDRAALVSSYFDHIDIKKQKREFVTHTGTLNKKRITVIGTGIGSGNIDIVLNECDAIKNIDFKERRIKNTISQLQFIRLGTTGSLQKNIDVDELILSTSAIAFDGLLQFYEPQYTENENSLLHRVQAHFSDFPVVRAAYVADRSLTLADKIEKHCHQGITLTSVGFYGPQHRELRAPILKKDLFDYAQRFSFNGNHITNFEMETAAIYGLGNLLNHPCCSISCVAANRATEKVSPDQPKAIKNMIEFVLESF